MKHIGIEKQSINLLNDYLNERTIYTEINTNKSNKVIADNIGVSQGSVLSSLLFLIYTLDMNMKHTRKKTY